MNNAIQATGEAMPISRRSLFAGALTAAVAAAMPALASGSDLERLIRDYIGATDALALVYDEIAALEAGFSDEIASLNLGFYTRTQSPWLNRWIASEPWWGSESVQAVIDETFAKVLAAAERRAADREGADMIRRGLAQGPDQVLAEKAEVLKLALPTGRKVDELYAGSGIVEAGVRADRAFEAAQSAQAALLAYRPATVAEVKHLARFLRDRIAGHSVSRSLMNSEADDLASRVLHSFAA